jgi:hypothetical protein
MVINKLFHNLCNTQDVQDKNHESLSYKQEVYLQSTCQPKHIKYFITVV